VRDGPTRACYHGRMIESIDTRAKPRPPVRWGDEVTLTIDRLSYGGRGVGRLDGYVIFVPDTAPGDVVRARVWRAKRGYAEADLLGIDQASGARVAPPCRHYGACGGCVWQHVEYAAQLSAKEHIVRETLAHMAGLPDVEIRPIIGMATPWYYRNKMEFTFHPETVLGLHRRRAFDRVVAIEECLLESPASNRILGIVREFAETSQVSRYDARNHSGLLRQAVIREGKASGEIMVGLITTAPEVPALPDLAARIVAGVPGVVGVVHGVNPGPSDGLPLSGVFLLAGRPYLVERLAGLEFRIGIETFFQTNTEQAERLIDTVIAAADLRGGELVYDLYCGVGTFALPLARGAGRVHGIEIAPAATLAARDNAALNRISNVDSETGDVRRILPALHRRAGRPDLVILDPPRGGAGSRVMRRVVATEAPRIIYVSCNPTTLAPDIKDLVAGGYAVRSVQPLDSFPHTHHVECVALLERVS
jgi:23S rRNA (uracil1939-C5)-methyltransferase